jgi:hypothetical protein
MALPKAFRFAVGMLRNFQLSATFGDFFLRLSDRFCIGVLQIVIYNMQYAEGPGRTGVVQTRCWS